MGNHFAEVSFMKSVLSLLSALHRDEEGAAFIEYTALLGVVLAVGLVVLTKVGNWATSSWSTLCSGLGTKCR